MGYKDPKNLKSETIIFKISTEMLNKLTAMSKEAGIENTNIFVRMLVEGAIINSEKTGEYAEYVKSFLPEA